MKELPAGWEWMKLSEISEKPQYGYTTSATPDGDGPLFVRTTDLTSGMLDWDNVPYCRIPPSQKEEEKYELSDGDILISRAGSVGSSFVIRDPPRSIFASYLIRFRLKENIYPTYVGYFLKSKLYWVQLKCRGTTLPGVNATNLAKIKIPIPFKNGNPDLGKQVQITNILEKAEQTKHVQEQANELIDDFLKSVFIEMFGDPINNPKGWPMKKLLDISEVVRDGPFGSNLKTEHYRPTGIRVIRLQNIGCGELIDDDKAFISPEHFTKIDKHKCLPGDLIIATLGDPIIRSFILPSSIEVALNKADCVQCRPDKDIVDPFYLNMLLNLPSIISMVSRYIHGQTRSRVSSGQLKKLKVPVPPLNLQKEFKDISQIIKGFKDKEKEESDLIDELFSCLTQKAFNGELIA
jgi:type I restriction enzyme S subunit